jgi:hypothetical protein
MGPSGMTSCFIAARPNKGGFIAPILALCDPMCDTMHMATNVEIDPELIKAALSLAGKRSKRAVIDEALREYVLRRQQRDVIKLFGSIDYDGSYDYKKQRSRR